MAKTQAPYDDGDGASGVVAYSDADGGIVPAGVAAYVDAGVAVPVDADHPLPVALPVGAATEETAAEIATGIGAPDDAAASTDTGTFSIVALLKRGLQGLATLVSRAPALVGGRVPVDGSGVTQPVSGPLTNAQLRAADVAVIGPVTDAQLRAAAVAVVEFPGAAVVANIASGATGAALTVGSGPLPNGANAWAIGISTPSSSAQTISFYIEQTDGTNWLTCPAVWLTPTRVGVGGIVTSMEYHQGTFLSLFRAHSEGRSVQIRFTSSPAPVAITVTFTPIFISTPTVQPVRAAAGASFPVQVTAGVGGAVAVYSAISTAGINAVSVVGGTRQMFSLWASNQSASTKYLKIYSQTAVPVPGTHTPALRYPLPPGFADFLFNSPTPQPLIGIALAITGGSADNDSTAIAAGDVTLNLHYST